MKPRSERSPKSTLIIVFFDCRVDGVVETTGRTPQRRARPIQYIVQPLRLSLFLFVSKLSVFLFGGSRATVATALSRRPLLILKIEFGVLNVCFRWTRVEPGQWAFDHPRLRYYIPVHTPRLRGKNMINHILHFSIRKKGNKIEERPDTIDRWRKLTFSFPL